MDIEARQLSLQYLNRAKQADTVGKTLLKEARKVNMALMSKPSDALMARRAVLARDAYNARMNAEAGRTMAAYALLAEREGTRAITANEAMQRVEASKRGILAEDVKGGQLRRNIMLQAAQAAEKALKAAPGVPAKLIGHTVNAASASQMTPDASGSMFRPKAYGVAMDSFFPEDVRRAASSLKGLSGVSHLDWASQLSAAIEQDAKAVREEAQKQATAVASQEPGAAALAQEAEGLIAQLQSQYHREMPTGEHPWLHMAGAAVAVFFILKVLK